MVSKAMWITILLGSFLVDPHSCCESLPPTPRDCHGPELLFPGLSESDARSTSNKVTVDTENLIKLVASATTGFIPVVGEWIDRIISGASAMASLLKTADQIEEMIHTIVNKKILHYGIQTIEVKVERIKELIKEKEGDGTIKLSSLELAYDKCREILLTYSKTDSPMFKDDNYFGSAPSLVSFTTIYTTVASMRLLRVPHQKGHILTGLEEYINTLVKYKDATVSKRMSYLYEIYIPRKKMCRVNGCGEFGGYTSCGDTFWKVLPNRGCFRGGCDGHGAYWGGIKEKYTNFFNVHISNVQKVVQELREK